VPVEVILPKVDMDMTHGTLAVWHVAPGDFVAKGAALFDIETDKAAMEVEAPATGLLHNVTAQPGDLVPVGTIVALIYAKGEAIGEAPLAGSASVSMVVDIAPVAGTVNPVPTDYRHLCQGACNPGRPCRCPCCGSGPCRYHRNWAERPDPARRCSRFAG
jgi:pyruvate/2-oxoglutarate dehydrogenase complex dihydrolipoamide acyltransferase (E2) component